MKIHEIIFVWCAALLISHVFWTNVFDGVINLEYIKYGTAALMIVWLSKYFLRKEHISFDSFIGPMPRACASIELGVVLVFTVIVGIGCWAALALLGAQFNATWAYERWGLISREDFEQVRLLKSWVFIYLMVGSVIVPITEEIIFRGFVLRRLRIKHSTRVAIVLSSLLFAVFHLDKSFIGSFLHGITFAILAVRFGSLYAPIIVHGLYNAAVLMLRVNFGLFQVADKTQIAEIQYWAPELACLFVGTIFVGMYFYRFDWRSPMPSGKLKPIAPSGQLQTGAHPSA